jgi:LuxR family quorum-sensing system transcriptional regulator CciR
MPLQPAARLWSFVENCGASSSIDDLGVRFLDEMAALGFPYVALSSHVDPLRPPRGAVMVLRYPESWVAHYSAERLDRVDPVFEAATRRTMPFCWEDPDFTDGLNRQQRRMLNEGREAGIGKGYTIPIGGPDSLPASCSLIVDDGGVDPRHYTLAHAMAVFAHERARQLLATAIAGGVPKLTARERECLALVARGKSDWVISCLLGVSEGAVNRTIERAKKRLGVATRTQAVVRAMQAGEISFFDLAD